MTPRSHAADIAREVSRFRRRAAAVSAARSGLVATAGAIVAAEVLWLWTGPVPAQAILLIVITPPVIAMLVARVTLPSTRAIAATADDRLRLQNRLATALECADQPDPFARLVVRDAVAAARQAQPAVAFPLRVPRVLAVLLLAAIGLPPLALLSDATTPLRQGPGGIAGAAGSAGAASGGTAPGGAGPAEGSAARETRPEPRQLPTTGATATPSAGRAPGALTAGEVAGRGAIRGAGSASSPDLKTAGGGVGGGVLIDSPIAPPPGVGAPQPSARQSWQTAQAAMSQERVPLRLRSYVQRYLSAFAGR